MAKSRIIPNRALLPRKIGIFCLLSLQLITFGRAQSVHASNSPCNELASSCTGEEHLRSKDSLQTAPANKQLTHDDIADDYITIEDAEIWYPILYKDKNFAKIETFVQQSLEAERSDEQVSAYLSRLYNNLSEVPSRIDSTYTAEDDEQFLEHINAVDEWISTDPSSHIPYLIKGMLLREYAWETRSRHTTHTATSEALPSFSRLVTRAKTNFDIAAELNPNDPNVWRELMFSTRENSNVPKHLEETYFQAGLAANPYHIGLWGTKAMNRRPVWCGSWEEMMEIARESEQLSIEAGKTLLSTVFLGVHRHIAYHDDSFQLGHPDIWPDVQAAFLRTIEAYPESLRMRFYYAHDAYFYADKDDIAVEQFDILGNHWTAGTAWNDLEEYHNARRYAYQSAAYDALLLGNYDRAERLALHSVEIEAHAYPYLILASVSNHRYQPEQMFYYAEQALANNPTANERTQAEEAITTARYHMNRN